MTGQEGVGGGWVRTPLQNLGGGGGVVWTTPYHLHMSDGSVIKA